MEIKTYLHIRRKNNIWYDIKHQEYFKTQNYHLILLKQKNKIYKHGVSALTERLFTSDS